MKIDEFEKVRNLNYDQYCDYLRSKYGIGLCDYFTSSWKKNPKVTRTKDGLFAHHVAEDKMVMLSEVKIAKLCPMEWQSKENLVYCDYLEHLFLHYLICKFPNPNKVPNADVGIGGVIAFLVPKLNDMYSGFPIKQNWEINCFNKVKDDLDVYLEIIKDFISWIKIAKPEMSVKCLFTSFNEQFKLWSAKNNVAVFEKILNIWEA